MDPENSRSGVAGTMEINNTKAYSAVLNTDVEANKTAAASNQAVSNQAVSAQAPSTADKVTLSPEALALASIPEDDDATVATEPPGWPPIKPNAAPAPMAATEPPGWPPTPEEKG